MSANVTFLRRNDSSQPRGIATPPRPFPTTWTTLLEPPPSFAPRDDPSSSWEPRVFAEDACSLLCGGSWPPRSYSCSFCKREFKSAQALGGHMNVHRRDRARLRQRSPSATDPASLALEPDLRSSDTSQATDQPRMRFAYPAPTDSSFSTSFATSSSLWHSASTSKPSFISLPLGAVSSVSLQRASFEDSPRDSSYLPGLASRSSYSASQFALQSMNSLPPAFSRTGVIAFPDQGSNPAPLFDTGKRHGVSTSLLQLKSESSRKKSVTSGGFQPYQTISVKNLDSVHLPRLRSEDRENDNVGPNDLDLELRLGQKP